jgi:hypothetical protein
MELPKRMFNAINLVTVITFTDNYDFFSFGATAPIWALAYLHETLRFTSVF